MRAARLDCEKRLLGHRANPFFVLELPSAAGRAEIERQGAKLLAMLAAGVAGAESCLSPVGRLERGPDAVRAALAELRDPARRLVHEWWARGLRGEARP